MSFSPYVNNGGTCLAVCGKDFAIISADTRLSTGYSIHTRTCTKTLKLTSKCVIGTSGMQADMIALHKALKFKIRDYVHTHGKEPSTPAIAQLLSTTLYQRRFFPFYTFNVLGGIDAEGKGCCFSYDAVGSFERVSYSSSGTGHELVQPLLDNQIGWKNQKSFRAIEDLDSETAVNLVKDVFTSAGERDIYTGDFVDICVVNGDGVDEIKFDLKFD